MSDGKSDSQEHIIFINTQMVIIEAIDSLKFKLMERMLKKVAFCWNMSLLRLSMPKY